MGGCRADGASEAEAEGGRMCALPPLAAPGGAACEGVLAAELGTNV